MNREIIIAAILSFLSLTVKICQHARHAAPVGAAFLQTRAICVVRALQTARAAHA